MENAILEPAELKRMRDQVSRTVNALELCWGCDRISECEPWLVNQAAPVWLCIECLCEVSYRLEKQTRNPLFLLPTSPAAK